MKNEVMKHEEYGEVRTVVLDAGKFFAGRDVAAALGYARPDLFVTRHVSPNNKQFVQMRALRSPVVARTAIINAAGVGELCDAAFCAVAEDIKHWLLTNADKPANNALQLFDDAEFGQIRWKIIDGDPWFVVADLCRILDIQNPSDVVAKQLDDDEKRKIPEIGVTVDPKYNSASLHETENGVTVDPRYNSAFHHEINVVNEFGLYRLITLSRKPAAKKFQRKVYHEILPSIRKYGYYSVKGEEPAKKTLKPLVPVAVVYAVLFANMLVKIGITCDFYRRLKELRKETHQDIVQFVTTPFKTLDDARLLELTLKAKFFNRLVKGEFFNVDFDTVKAALLAEDKVNKLLAIADRLPDSEEKTRLVLQAASLI